MNEKETGLSEESILLALTQIVARINRGNLSGALDTLVYLNFDRLLPGKDQRTLHAVDRGRAFGPERVRETSDQIHLCELALQKSDTKNALDAANAAVARWRRA